MDAQASGKQCPRWSSVLFKRDETVIRSDEPIS
jgi:hypothetical protein